MPYRFAIEDEKYADLSAGRVLYSHPGFPAFPVRLASEMFQRAQALTGRSEPLAVYDPTCGGAYHLTALGFLHGDAIGSIIASDSDPLALSLAGLNLSLLSQEGLARREQDIRAMLASFGKQSHAEALESLLRLREIRAAQEPINTHLFTANVFDRDSLTKNLGRQRVDLILSDVPYGRMTGWQATRGEPQGSTPLWEMLDSLRSLLAPGVVLAIAADKSQKIAHEGYQREERFQVGKRQVSLLRRLPG